MSRLLAAIEPDPFEAERALCEKALGNLIFVVQSNRFFDTKACLHRENSIIDKLITDTLPLHETKTGIAYGCASQAFFQSAFFDKRVTDYMELDSSKEFGEITERRNIKFANVYDASQGDEGIEGDITPFWDAMDVLLENKDDQKLLVEWMAHVIQNSGNPNNRNHSIALLAGGEGGGKSTLYDIMQRAIGDKYTAKITQAAIEEKNTAWLKDRTLINFDELLPSKCVSIVEKTKAWTTDKYLSIREMSKDWYDVPNVVSFLMSTNYLDAVAIEATNSRISGYVCRFKTKPEMDEWFGGSNKREDFFLNYYDWLKNKDGYAKIIHMLRTLKCTRIKANQRAVFPSTHNQLIGYAKTNAVMETEQLMGFLEALECKVFDLERLSTVLRHLGVKISTKAQKRMFEDAGWEYFKGTARPTGDPRGPAMKKFVRPKGMKGGDIWNSFYSLRGTGL